MDTEKEEQAVSIAISKGLVWGLGSIIVAGIIGFCSALFVMYQDVTILKTDNERWTQSRQVSVKQWEKLRRLKDKEASDIKEIHAEIDEVRLYLYTFHGLDIMNIPHDHKEGR